MGVLTNYNQWYFVKYNILKEIEKSSLSPDCFEVSERFDLTHNYHGIDEGVLNQVTQIMVQWLRTCLQVIN